MCCHGNGRSPGVNQTTFCSVVQLSTPPYSGRQGNSHRCPYSVSGTRLKRFGCYDTLVVTMEIVVDHK